MKRTEDVYLSEDRLQELGEKLLKFGQENKLTEVQLWFFCRLMDGWLKRELGIVETGEIEKIEEH